MSIVTNQTTKLIGKTPVYQLPNTNIYVKLEKYNVGGSVKDRAVLGMLQDAKEKDAFTKIALSLKLQAVIQVLLLPWWAPSCILKLLLLCLKA